MPELPDVVVYVERLDGLLTGRILQRIRLASPFLVRSYDPPIREVHGKTVTGFRRIGKRIVWELEDDLRLVMHLMISGRLRWKEAGVTVPKKRGLAAFDFEHGSVLFTEASTKKRASLYLVRGDDAVAEHDRGGIEILESPLDAFTERLRSRNHTLKRALTDQHLFSGVGNAYSDEILHRAGLSPVTWTSRLDDDGVARLYEACRTVLAEWTDRMRDEVGDGFPDKVTAFRPEMAVHGKFKEPCPVCGTKVQRIRYASNESNYCPTCQTGGKLLADRSLSRLMKKDWPKTLEELEERKAGGA